MTFVLDRAGVTGSDGPSHHGMWELSLLGTAPGMRVAAPRDATRLRELLGESLVVHDGPTALRFPKGSAPSDIDTVGHLGTADVVRASTRRDVLVLALGPMVQAACQAADQEYGSAGTEVTVVDPRWAQPVDPSLVRAAAGFRHVITVEDHGIADGFGDAVARELRQQGCRTPLTTLGIPQRYLRHGERGELLTELGLDAAGIARAIAGRPGGVSRTCGPSLDKDAAPALRPGPARVASQGRRSPSRRSPARPRPRRPRVRGLPDGGSAGRTPSVE